MKKINSIEDFNLACDTILAERKNSSPDSVLILRLQADCLEYINTSEFDFDAREKLAEKLMYRAGARAFKITADGIVSFL